MRCKLQAIEGIIGAFFIELEFEFFEQLGLALDVVAVVNSILVIIFFQHVLPQYHPLMVSKWR